MGVAMACLAGVVPIVARPAVVVFMRDRLHGLRSGLWLDRARGTGVAFFVTGLSTDPPRGRSAFRAAEEMSSQP